MGSRLQEAFLRPAARLPRERKHASRRSTWDGEQTTRSLPSTSSKVTKGTETCKPPEHLGWGADYKKPSFDQQQGYQGNGNMQAAGAPGMGSEQVMVPDNMVGLIIGRGGEQITRLQAESGCKIQMSQGSQGMPHRLCTLTGSPEAIGVARGLIDNIIANEGSRGGPRGGGGGGPMGGDFGGGGYEMMVPGHLA